MIYTRTASLALSLSTIALALSPIMVHAAISRNLRMGDTGEDVRELQRLLNSDSSTSVATSGPGSPGQETTYFGTLTFAAVKRFQEKHAAEVLLPLGISTPTGFVGERTRAKLASLGGVPAATPAATSELPIITGVSPSVITAPTTVVTITGKNFSATNNTVSVSSDQTRAITGVASTDGETAQFTYSPGFVELLKTQITNAQYPGGKQELAKIMAENIVEKNPVDGSVKIPFLVYVHNGKGISSPYTIHVDVSEILMNISQ